MYTCAYCFSLFLSLFLVIIYLLRYHIPVNVFYVGVSVPSNSERPLFPSCKTTRVFFCFFSGFKKSWVWIEANLGVAYMRNRVRGSQDPRAGELLYCVPPKTHEVGSSCCSLFTPSFLETGDFCMILPSFQVLGFFLFVFGFFTCGNDRNICVAHHGVARSHQVLRPCIVVYYGSLKKDHGPWHFCAI